MSPMNRRFRLQTALSDLRPFESSYIDGQVGLLELAVEDAAFRGAGINVVHNSKRFRAISI